MNLLLTSVGRRSYLIKYFRDALNGTGEVHVSNSSSMTPAFNIADKTVVTPLIYEEEYIPFLLEYCRKNSISAVLPLFDVDLPILSANKRLFDEIECKVIVSDFDVINICNDKLLTYKFLIKNGFNAPKTYADLCEVKDSLRKGYINYPLIVKPRWGMGSIGIFQADNEEELSVLYNKVKAAIQNSYLKYESDKGFDSSVIIQEKLIGQEYGIDVINDLEMNYQNTIVKKKYAMRSGETDCAEIVDDSTLKELGARLGKELGHIANLDVDAFVVDGTQYILEMNARFGGGYPFSYLAGVNLPLAIIKWLNGEKIDMSILTEKVGIIAHKDIEVVIIAKDVDRK